MLMVSRRGLTGDVLAVGSLFAGIGGFDLGLERAGMRTLWFCEQDEFCQRVLARHWPGVPCYGDVRTLVADPSRHGPEEQAPSRTVRERARSGGERGGAGEPLPVPVPYVDVLCGGFPCTDLSYAGRGAGLFGEQSGLWFEFARLIRELRPRYVVIENVPGLFRQHDIEWPADRCVCGWVDRRRGLHLDSQEQLDDPGRRRHEREGDARAALAGSALRRQGAPDPQSHREMGGGLLLDAHRPQARAVPTGHPATPAAEGEPGGHRTGGPGAATVDADDARRPDALDCRWANGSGTTAVAAAGRQPQGATARADARRPEDCPACGRTLGGPTGEPVRRSWLDVVQADLAACGYDSEWDCLPASAFGAPHRRDRIWLVAYPQGAERRTPELQAVGSPAERAAELGELAGPFPRARHVAYPAAPGLEGHRPEAGRDGALDAGWWAVEPGVGRVAHGIPARVDRLRALGNSLVPQIAEWIGNRIVEWEGL